MERSLIVYHEQARRVLANSSSALYLCTKRSDSLLAVLFGQPRTDAVASLRMFRGSLQDEMYLLVRSSLISHFTLGVKGGGRLNGARPMDSILGRKPKSCCT